MLYKTGYTASAKTYVVTGRTFYSGVYGCPGVMSFSYDRENHGQDKMILPYKE